MRTIGRIDIKGRNCIKGISMEGQFVVAPALNVFAYLESACDEIFICDTVASHFGVTSLHSVVRDIVKYKTKPLIVGGGINSVSDALSLFDLGADKIAVNSALFHSTDLLSDLIDRFGCQSIVVSLQAVKNESDYVLAYDYGREHSKYTLSSWLDYLYENNLFPGELLVTSVLNDGTLIGPDFELLSQVVSKSHCPVIFGGGISSSEDITKLSVYGADALCIGKLFHDKYQDNYMTICSSSNPTHYECTNAIIGILDIGFGNTTSLQNLISSFGYDVVVLSTLDDLTSVNLLFLPGVGNFGALSSSLDKLQLRHLLIEYIESGNSVIGICLGMQFIYTTSSESTNSSGLDLVSGRVTHFNDHIKNPKRLPILDSEMFAFEVLWSTLLQQKTPSTLFIAIAMLMYPMILF